MSPPPAEPKIYHITHVDNLAHIVRAGVLWSDAERIAQGLECEVVGMATIKRRRLEVLPVKCHPGTTVGQYVPFYFCPRSVMLYILQMGNHPELSYRGGQRPILHLVADLNATVAWARASGCRWAFSDRNAGAAYASFFSRTDQLEKINWEAVDARDFRDSVIQEGKQAEFLVHESFPWTLIANIGVKDAAMADRVRSILENATHQPVVSVEPTWYY